MTLEEKLKYLHEFYIEMRKRIIMGHYQYGDTWKDMNPLKEKEAEQFDGANYEFFGWLQDKTRKKNY